MTHHYGKNTEAISHYCSVCNRVTMHKVWDGRLGPCVEQHAKEEVPPKVQVEDKQQDLFSEEA